MNVMKQELVSLERIQVGFVTNQMLTYITDSSTVVTMLHCKEYLLTSSARVVMICQVQIK
jgi:hypothetical protein